MMRWSQFVSILAVAGLASARRSTGHLAAFQQRFERAGRDIPTPKVPLVNRERQESHKRATTSQFLTSSTEKFVVNGSAIPDIDFDVGESYAGLIPVTTDADGNYLYFWFFPSTNAAADKEIVIWLNGGPGCSSLEGILQENGPFIWQYGTFKPVKNPFSWHKLSNVLWVEQPVLTGFSKGTVTATSEEDVARQFMSWFKNFVDTFGMQGYKVYITGESYSGMYVSYIASAMLDSNETSYYNVSGIMLYDPFIGYDYIQSEVTTMPFVEYWSGLFALNETALADARAQDVLCGYADFRDKYFTFPPSGPFPGPNDLPNANNKSCSVWNDVFDAVTLVNPCFNFYQIATTCPLLWDVNGFPGSLEYVPEGASIYFNRTDVQQAINAPQMEWRECANANVFVDGNDNSLPSAVSALPSVIDRTQNVIIGHGALDYILIANGTLLQLQNMTWGGKQGFQSPPAAPFYVPHHAQVAQSSVADGTLAGAGVMGALVTERGLTYVDMVLAGHMVPQFAPSAAFRQLEVLLGRVASLSSTEPFTVGVGDGGEMGTAVSAEFSLGVSHS